MMTEYWRGYYANGSRRFSTSLLKQVGKTINGDEISDDQVSLIVNHVSALLDLDGSDCVLDLCCGNGLLTTRYAPLVRRVVGVDYTKDLIHIALRGNHCRNVEYVHADVLHLEPQYVRDATQIIMYEALQHFTMEEFRSLLSVLTGMQVGARFFVGSVPDRNKLKIYYDTEEKLDFFRRCEASGEPHIGRWWSPDEIDSLSSAGGFTMRYVPQTPSLYTAYYRFDVILEKRT